MPAACEHKHKHHGQFRQRNAAKLPRRVANRHSLRSPVGEVEVIEAGSEDLAKPGASGAIGNGVRTVDAALVYDHVHGCDLRFRRSRIIEDEQLVSAGD